MRSLSCVARSADASLRTVTPRASSAPSAHSPSSTPSSEARTSSRPRAASPGRSTSSASSGVMSSQLDAVDDGSSDGLVRRRRATGDEREAHRLQIAQPTVSAQGRSPHRHRADTSRRQCRPRASSGPPLFDAGVLESHRRRGVQIEGYSPLKTINLRDPRLVQIAESHSVTSAQVVLRWHIEHRIVAIPRSANAERIAENADIFGFALTSSDVEILDSFASGGRAR